MKKIVEDLLYKELSYQIHGAAIEVRKDFGSGHKEKLYQQALAKEFERRGIKFEQEKAIKIYSPKDGKFIGLYRPDFIVDDKIIIETKAEKFVSREEIKRIYDYLRNSKHELAYFMNFVSPRLYVRRIVYSSKHKPKIGAGVVSLLALISLALASFSGVRAASVRAYLDAPPEVAVGSEFPVTIFLESDAALNAYSFELAHSPNLAPTTFDWRNSIVDLRQDQPRLTEKGAIFFEGGSLAPFRGDAGKIVTLNFKALASGAGKFGFAKAEVFLADGKGTKVLPARESLIVQIAAREGVAGTSTGIAPEAREPAIKDKTPPEIKAISFGADPVNGSQKILGFIVADSGSGVRAVEARARKFLFWGEWTPVQSPIAVSRDVWSVALRVTDGEGNIAEKTLYDWRAFVGTFALPALAFFALAAVAVFLMRRKARKEN